MVQGFRKESQQSLTTISFDAVLRVEIGIEDMWCQYFRVVELIIPRTICISIIASQPRPYGPGYDAMFAAIT